MMVCWFCRSGGHDTEGPLSNLGHLATCAGQTEGSAGQCELPLTTPRLMHDDLPPPSPVQLASLVHVSASGSTDHALSNWLGRLHQLKRVREKVLSETQGHRRTAPTPHFTAYS